MSDTIHLRLTGTAALWREGQQAQALDPAGALLAARLALDGPQPRARMALQLWPAVSEARARANLRQRLLRLRLLAGVDWLVGDAVLSLAPGVVVLPADTPEGGELLDGLVLSGREELAQWLDLARARQRQGRLRTLAERAVQAEAAEQFDDALVAVQAMLGIDPLAETHHRTLMRLHYLRGDAASALRAYGALRDMLSREFGAEPGVQTLALWRCLQAGQGLVRVGGSRRGAQAQDQVDAREPSGFGQPGEAQVSASAGLPSRATPVSLLRPPRMVGRDVEFARIARCLAEGGAVLVRGEAGMGKSRVLAEWACLSGGVWQVKAAAGDAGVPYATLARLMRAAVQGVAAPSGGRPLTSADVAALPAPLARLWPDLKPSQPLPGPTDDERLHLQAAIEAHMLKTGCRLVVVDDLHFADDASLEMLQSLVGAAPGAGCAWLMARRPGEGSAAADRLHDALQGAQRLDVLTLAPLDDWQMTELVASLHIDELNAAVLGPRLVRHTGGNPLFALETLKQMWMAGLPTADLPLPASVEALMDRRLRHLPGAALALARVAAVAGPDFDARLAAAVLGQPVVDLSDAWAELEAAQVLRDNGFAHDLMLEAVLRSMPKAIRVELHAAVARCLQKDGAQAARLAAHWLAAGDVAEALPCLLQAADLARDAMRRREQAGFLEQAADIAAGLGDGAERAGSHPHDLYVRAYLTRECVDGVTQALPLLDRALSLARDPIDRARVLALRAEGRVKLFELEGAVNDGQAALAHALQAGDDTVTADIMSSLASALSMLGRHDEAAALLDRHWPLVQAMPEAPTAYFGERGLVLDNAGRPHEGRPFHEQAVQLARQRAQHSEWVIGCHNLAVNHMDAGELRAAEDLLAQGEALRAAHDGLDGANLVGWNLQASVWRDLGRYRLALTACNRVLEPGPQQLPARVPVDRLHRAWLWYWTGQWARAGQDPLSPSAYEGLSPWVAPRALQLRARLRAAQGLSADGLLAEAVAQLPPGALRTMRESVWLDTAAADPDPPRALARVQVWRSDAEADRLHGLRWRAEWLCAQLALAAGRTDEAARHAAACAERPAAHTPLDLAEGHWWHGLWRVWKELGDEARAETARAQGLAWIRRTLRHELDVEFHASFRHAVRAHRDLLGGLDHPQGCGSPVTPV